MEILALPVYLTLALKGVIMVASVVLDVIFHNNLHIMAFCLVNDFVLLLLLIFFVVFNVECMGAAYVIIESMICVGDLFFVGFYLFAVPFFYKTFHNVKHSLTYVFPESAPYPLGVHDLEDIVDDLNKVSAINIALFGAEVAVRVIGIIAVSVYYFYIERLTAMLYCAAVNEKYSADLMTEDNGEERQGGSSAASSMASSEVIKSMASSEAPNAPNATNATTAITATKTTQATKATKASRASRASKTKTKTKTMTQSTQNTISKPSLRKKRRSTTTKSKSAMHNVTNNKNAPSK